MQWIEIARVETLPEQEKFCWLVYVEGVPGYTTLVHCWDIDNFLEFWVKFWK